MQATDDEVVRFVAGLTLAPRQGSNGWQLAICPFHDDRHPSFSFNVDEDRWKCFAGCGGGRLSLLARYGPRR
jgi:hypothetical protein